MLAGARDRVGAQTLVVAAADGAVRAHETLLAGLARGSVRRRAAAAVDVGLGAVLDAVHVRGRQANEVVAEAARAVVALHARLTVAAERRAVGGVATAVDVALAEVLLAVGVAVRHADETRAAERAHAVVVQHARLAVGAGRRAIGRVAAAVDRALAEVLLAVGVAVRRAVVRRVASAAQAVVVLHAHLRRSALGRAVGRVAAAVHVAFAEVLQPVRRAGGRARLGDAARAVRAVGVVDAVLSEPALRRHVGRRSAAVDVALAEVLLHVGRAGARALPVLAACAARAVAVRVAARAHRALRRARGVGRSILAASVRLASGVGLAPRVDAHHADRGVVPAAHRCVGARPRIRRGVVAAVAAATSDDEQTKSDRADRERTRTKH